MRTDASLIGDLARYRQLIELQKQIVELAKENEHAKLACNKLRENVVTKIIRPAAAQKSLLSKANKMFDHLPATVMKLNSRSFTVKEQSV